MSKIILIASDFDSLESLSEQYINNKDCPIARAAKRAGYSNVDVDPFYLDKECTIRINGAFGEVKRCMKELKNGATEAYIEILN